MTIDISPSAARLTQSLRDLGYDFNAAIADLVDNSIEAGASRVDIAIRWNDGEPWIRISDDGSGMTPSTINEAIRFGTRRTYSDSELGRYGLGLKTATFSQCRKLLIASRASQRQRRIYAREVDLDTISQRDRWDAQPIASEQRPWRLIEPLQNETGTVVVWEKLDRVLNGVRSDGWARRRLLARASSLGAHLGMVFHRFIDGAVPGRGSLKLTVNDEVVQAWDPFATSEPATIALPIRRISVRSATASGLVSFVPHVLPHRDAFSSPGGFDHFAGPKKWNRQQGLYIYRSHRLVQSGGWAGVRAIDEHTKFARAAIEFDSHLDEVFNVNVAKMRVSIPSGIRDQLTQPIAELVKAAQFRYRRGQLDHTQRYDRESPVRADLRHVGLTLRAAAMSTEQSAALDLIAQQLGKTAPELANQLGWIP